MHYQPGKTLDMNTTVMVMCPVVAITKNQKMDQNPKQQVIERLKSASNVLVTVSNSPSVDQLAAAIAMTLMINSMGKHATAVFSGVIPDTMQFLEPSKTLENTVDSLRDFIIALDKGKADKLRYKVENDVVKIFITPYRTRISEADLTFSQGDYNVDVVLALGVHTKEELDRVIVEHGRILHDAAVVSVNTGVSEGDLGSINWVDASSSSLCEMMMSISEALQSGLVDQQVATALLTGIVSETNRFSNDKTSPKVMTMAAQLMASGANQQLIASNLHPVIQNASDASVVDKSEVPPPSKDPSEMTISHDSGSAEAKNNQKPELVNNESQNIDVPSSEQPATPPPGPIADLIHDTKTSGSDGHDVIEKPALGGTFNATATQAHDEAERMREQAINNTLLNHSGTEEEKPIAKAPDLQTPALDTPKDDFSKPLQSLSQQSPPPSPLPSPVPSIFDQNTSPAPQAPMPPISQPQNNVSIPAPEFNPAEEATRLDKNTLESIDSTVREDDTKRFESTISEDTAKSLDLESARKAVEEATSGFVPGVPTESVGSSGLLEVRQPITTPEPNISIPESYSSPLPPPLPPPFGAVAPASPTASNDQIQNSSAESNPVTPHRDFLTPPGGYQPPATNSNGQNNPSDEFTLPPIQ